MEEVLVEGEEDLVEAAVPAPYAIAAIAGWMGWIAGREVFPRGIGTDLPEDGIQDRARVEGRAAAGGLGGVVVENGLEEAPLLVSEV